MPKLGRCTRYKSFLRQLSMYKFHRITSGSLRGSYHHPFFFRNHIYCCRGVLRGCGVRDYQDNGRGGGGGSAAAENEMIQIVTKTKRATERIDRARRSSDATPSVLVPGAEASSGAMMCDASIINEAASAAASSVTTPVPETGAPFHTPSFLPEAKGVSKSSFYASTWWLEQATATEEPCFSTLSSSSAMARELFKASDDTSKFSRMMMTKPPSTVAQETSEIWGGVSHTGHRRRDYFYICTNLVERQVAV
jgi:hypothetical protein